MIRKVGISETPANFSPQEEPTQMRSIANITEGVAKRLKEFEHGTASLKGRVTISDKNRNL